MSEIRAWFEDRRLPVVSVTEQQPAPGKRKVPVVTLECPLKDLNEVVLRTQKYLGLKGSSAEVSAIWAAGLPAVITVTGFKL